MLFINNFLGKLKLKSKLDLPYFFCNCHNGQYFGAFKQERILGPAEVLWQHRFWPKYFFAAKICFQIKFQNQKFHLNGIRSLVVCLY